MSKGVVGVSEINVLSLLFGYLCCLVFCFSYLVYLFLVCVCVCQGLAVWSRDDFGIESSLCVFGRTALWE